MILYRCRKKEEEYDNDEPQLSLFKRSDKKRSASCSNSKIRRNLLDKRYRVLKVSADFFTILMYLYFLYKNELFIVISFDCINIMKSLPFETFHSDILI